MRVEYASCICELFFVRMYSFSQGFDGDWTFLGRRFGVGWIMMMIDDGMYWYDMRGFIVA